MENGFNVKTFAISISFFIWYYDRNIILYSIWAPRGNFLRVIWPFLNRYHWICVITLPEVWVSALFCDVPLCCTNGENRQYHLRCLTNTGVRGRGKLESRSVTGAPWPLSPGWAGVLQRQWEQRRGKNVIKVLSGKSLFNLSSPTRLILLETGAVFNMWVLATQATVSTDQCSSEFPSPL